MSLSLVLVMSEHLLQVRARRQRGALGAERPGFVSGLCGVDDTWGGRGSGGWWLAALLSCGPMQCSSVMFKVEPDRAVDCRGRLLRTWGLKLWPLEI